MTAWMQRFACSLLLAGATTLCGCGGGMTDSGPGRMSLVLTDTATEDLTQFEVDVRDIVLHKVGGATVSVLQKATRVDFLQLESVAELVASASLEIGYYDSIDLTLDFATASVIVVGQTTPATVKDQAGNTLTGDYTVTVSLATGSRPFVRAGRGHLLQLDLDLDQSLSVDTGMNTVTFAPVWSVETDPSAPKPITTTGTLLSIDGANSLFYVERRAIDDTVLDTFSVRTSGTTLFQLGGDVQVGALGLGSLAGYLGQRLFVQGTFDNDNRTIRGVAVETGPGVPGNGQDWVFGHVVARSGAAGADATLTVLGRSLDVGTSTRTYNTMHTVDVSHANTRVLRRGVGSEYGTDAINVGQLVWVFGSLTGTTLDATATDAVARMLRTGIFGIANGVPAGDTLTVDVQRFDLRDVSAFDFDVSGQVQADPNAFTIDVTGLSTAGITAGSRLRVLGWIGPVGGSGDDAAASSIVDRTNGTKLLLCAWAPAATNVLDVGSTSIAIDVSGAALHSVADGFAPVDLTVSPQPTIAPLLTSGFYRIVQDGAVTVYASFNEFKSAVALRAAGGAVARVSALGTFAAPTQAFSAVTVTVVLD